MRAYFLVLSMILSSCQAHKMKMIDLTHAFGQDTIYWPTEDGFKHDKEHFGETEKGYFYSSYRFSGAEHGGTHIDAPIHFSKTGDTVDTIPLSKLLGPAVLVDVSEACQKDRDYEITVEDLLAWEAKNKKSLLDKIVLLKTGFAQYWPDRKLYLGTDEHGAGAVSKLHFPGLSPKAALWLTKERNIRSIGIDTASIDFGQSTLYESHRSLFESNVPAFENVALLSELPTHGFHIIALPMKISNGSGGPVRIIAVVP